MAGQRPWGRARAAAQAAAPMWLVVALVATLLSACQTAAYYVDASGGSDANSGTSPSSPWRSLAKASSVPSGSRLYLRAGQTFTGTLTIPASRVEVAAYGAGGPPTLEQGHYAGVEVRGDDVVVRGLLIRHNVAGVFTRAGAERADVHHNWLVDNNRMKVNTPGGQDDSGAFGVLIHGDDGEFHHNVVAGSDTMSYDFGRDGAAFEVYGGSRNRVFHNTAHNNQTFAELGKPSSDPESADNQFAYNRVTGTDASMLGVVTRGTGSFGPVHGTRLKNNTIALTGPGSEGFVCLACSSDVLVMSNNIVRAAGKVGYADGPFGGDHNLYSGGQTQFTRRPHDLVADPAFVSDRDLHLRPISPARNSGLHTAWGADLDGTPVPQEEVTDRGAYEFR